MKENRLIKVLLSVIAVLLFLNLLHTVSTRTAVAVQNEEIGRYQISAWAAQSGAFIHHSGYYIIDTKTGRLVDSKAEVHGSKE